MHFYKRWTVAHLPQCTPEGVDAVIAEVCSDGFVCREICLDPEGRIIRCAPTRQSSSVLLGNRALPERNSPSISTPPNLKHFGRMQLMKHNHRKTTGLTPRPSELTQHDSLIR